VGDDDFDFGSSGERREARTFEPPPWERDQFERLAREREREKAAEEAARKPAEGAGLDRDASGEHATTEAKPTATAPFPWQDAEASGDTRHGEIGATEAAVDDRQIAAMMIGLKAEEPPALGNAWVVALMSAIVVTAVGFLLVVWGLTEAARAHSGPTGAMGAAILLLFGLGFGALGGWLGFRTLRQRGVL
jgi:hypothetical protein